MALRIYDLQDLELIKAAPRQLGEDGYRALAVGEFWFREKRQHPQHVLVMVHGYLRRAHEAYERNGKESPWFLGKTDYERKPVELKAAPPEPAPAPQAPPSQPDPVPAPVIVSTQETMRPATVELHNRILDIFKAADGKAQLWRVKQKLAEFGVDEDKADRHVRRLVDDGYLQHEARGQYSLTAKVKG